RLSVAIAAVIVSGISIASVVWERSLPPLVNDAGIFTAFYKIWVTGVGLLYAIGATLSLVRYRSTGDPLLGYVSFLQIAITFIQARLVAGGQRYGYLFLGTRLLLIASFATMLIGLLAGYVELFRRERDKAIQLQGRSAELLAILESIPDAVIV